MQKVNLCLSQQRQTNVKVTELLHSSSRWIGLFCVILWFETVLRVSL